ncbi:MAG: HepT-like ribonuclease domain-containing protein [Desulfobaccales bacterium]
MSRDYKIYCDDIIESIEKINCYIFGMDLDTFSNDRKTIDAVIMNLVIIGEAARKLPEELRIKFPDIEWARIIGLRNIIVHDYPSINLRIIWSIVKNNLPFLDQQIRKIIHEV